MAATCTQTSYTKDTDPCTKLIGCIKNSTQEVGNCICDTTNNFIDGTGGACACKSTYGLNQENSCVQCTEVETQQIDSNGKCTCKDPSTYDQDPKTGKCTQKSNVVNCQVISTLEDCNKKTGCAWDNTKNCICKDNPDADPTKCPIGGSTPDSGPSSASPLTIALIFALILILLSAMTAGIVVVKRKATRREVLVNEAL